MRLAVELARGGDEELLFVTVWKELKGDFGLPYLEILAPDARSICAIAAVASAAACGGGGPGQVCADADSSLGGTAFVFVRSPQVGDRVSSGFHVGGCSSTYEGSVNWRLRARDGRELASGFAQGGSLRPAPFQFRVTYSVAVRQIGQLDVSGPAVSREGFAPVRNVLPVVLQP